MPVGQADWVAVAIAVGIIAALFVPIVLGDLRDTCRRMMAQRTSRQR
ncbi:MAG: hypothetical protein U5K37_13230 [Natrialbaceae archaeon]|nr:hypothetical protein [Natrialbaceae archaeon]